MVSSRVKFELTPRTRVRRAAAAILEQAVGDCFACLPAALAGEVEAGIHEMRVRAKKLRERMRLFRPAYHRLDFNAGLELIEQLNDRLGSVRDDDVFLIRLADLGSVAPDLVPALQAVAETSRSEHQQTLTTLLQQLAAETFEARLRKLIDEGRHTARHPVAGMTCRRFARTEISSRLGRVLCRMARVEDEEDTEGLHAVRVVNKHLRYAMEPFLGIFGKKLQQAFRRVVELHGVLGDLHDFDVLLVRLSKQAQKLGRSAEVEPLLSRVRELRRSEYERFLPYFNADGEATFARLISDALD
ncbi:MAG: CHAD domain-containing protein [Fimbriimonadaceae bacterium]|nr:CHAD domain-containing protein [Fimbriimonadaceae bacterium]